MSQRVLFGTDGIRGVAGEGALTPTSVMAIGAALGRALGAGGGASVVMGRDTRRSGTLLEGALSAGLCAAGVDVLSLGVLPTPAIALAVRQRGAAAGVVISASHNPFEDNGVKVFGPDGFKLPDAVEAQLERHILAGQVGCVAPREIGRVQAADGVEPYLALLRAAAGVRLDGLRVCLDLANGAAAGLGARAFEQLGAQVEILGAAPDGVNINAGCGALHPEGLAARVKETGADLGVAVDGDADRCIVVDEGGQLRDGDAVMGVLATWMLQQGELPGPAVVATSMSNLGLEVYLKRQGIDLLRTQVGDRYVVEALRARGLRLGGEQSGHVVDLGHQTTGDGLLTAVRLAAIMVRSGRSLGRWCEGIPHFPQVLHNVRISRRRPLEELPGLTSCIEDAERRLGGEGRVVVRLSGTEPKARVMVEGPDQATIQAIAEEIGAVIVRHLGG